MTEYREFIIPSFQDLQPKEGVTVLDTTSSADGRDWNLFLKIIPSKSPNGKYRLTIGFKRVGVAQAQFEFTDTLYINSRLAHWWKTATSWAQREWMAFNKNLVDMTNCKKNTKI